MNDDCIELKKQNEELKKELDSLLNKKNLSSIHSHKKITGLMEEIKYLTEEKRQVIQFIDEIIEKYKNSMTDEPSTTNHYCNNIINDLKKLKKSYNSNSSEENEQLKSFKSRVFNLLQDEIREESELLDYYLKEKTPYNADRQQIIIGVLKRLQKELEK